MLPEGTSLGALLGCDDVGSTVGKKLGSVEGILLPEGASLAVSVGSELKLGTRLGSVDVVGCMLGAVLGGVLPLGLRVGGVLGRKDGFPVGC